MAGMGMLVGNPRFSAMWLALRRCNKLPCSTPPQPNHFNQPRRRKYHIGTTALAAINTMAMG